MVKPSSRPQMRRGRLAGRRTGASARPRAKRCGRAAAAERSGAGACFFAVLDVAGAATVCCLMSSLRLLPVEPWNKQEVFPLANGLILQQLVLMERFF